MNYILYEFTLSLKPEMTGLLWGGVFMFIDAFNELPM